MFDAVTNRFADTDITVMAAAVGDFRPVEQARDKIKKNGRSGIELELTSNPDILAWAGEHKRPDQTLCGFAMETRDLEANAAKKQRQALRHAGGQQSAHPGAGFATDTNVVTVLTPGETADRPSIERWSKMGKDALAKRILVKLAAMRADGERR